VNRAFDLTVAAAASRIRIVTATQFEHVAIVILDHFIATDDIAESKPDFATGFQAEILSRRILHEIVLLNVQFSRERHLALTQFGSHGVIQSRHHFDLVLRIIGQYDFERPHDSHAALRGSTQILPNAVFEQRHLDRILFFGYTNTFAKIAQCCRRIATASHARQCGHARIVPTADHAVFLLVSA
jgi:hypothetical protein